MNKLLKYGMSTIAVAALSGSVAWYVAQKTLTNQASSNEQINISEQTTDVNKYGFSQTEFSNANGHSLVAPDLVDAAENSVHAVVHIKAEGEQQYSQQMIDPFEFFFGGGGGFQRPQTKPVTSFGSGVIISTDGYIITNNHVVENAKRLQIMLNDNRSFEGKVIGTDLSTDIALIKIEADDLPTIPFGDSDQIKLGEWVLAVGNPFNLTSTVTAGIISAKARPAGSGVAGQQNKIGTFIQTDAAVNAGNSGGALVNSEGELIGINTMIYSRNGSYSGYSFAVPINLAAKVVSDIKKYGSAQRAVLGISMMELTPELIEKENLKTKYGAYVADFAEVSAAYAAGIEKGDVIVEVDGHKIDSSTALQQQIIRHRPGEKINITVNRQGKEHTYKVELKNVEGTTSVVKVDNSTLLGAKVREISHKEMRSYGISYGLEVKEVGSGQLKEVGVKKGFIILSINNQAVRSVKDAIKLTQLVKQQQRGDKAVLIKGFYPNGRIKYYAVDLS